MLKADSIFHISPTCKNKILWKEPTKAIFNEEKESKPEIQKVFRAFFLNCKIIH